MSNPSSPLEHSPSPSASCPSIERMEKSVQLYLRAEREFSTVISMLQNIVDARSEEKVVALAPTIPRLLPSVAYTHSLCRSPAVGVVCASLHKEACRLAEQVQTRRGESNEPEAVARSREIYVSAFQHITECSLGEYKAGAAAGATTGWKGEQKVSAGNVGAGNAAGHSQTGSVCPVPSPSVLPAGAAGWLFDAAVTKMNLEYTNLTKLNGSPPVSRSLDRLLDSRELARESERITISVYQTVRSIPPLPPSSPAGTEESEYGPEELTGRLCRCLNQIYALLKRDELKIAGCVLSDLVAARQYVDYWAEQLVNYQ